MAFKVQASHFTSKKKAKKMAICKKQRFQDTKRIVKQYFKKILEFVSDRSYKVWLSIVMEENQKDLKIWSFY